MGSAIMAHWVRDPSITLPKWRYSNLELGQIFFSSDQVCLAP